jgi:hypothetical protein
MASRAKAKQEPARSPPVSLAPLSFEDALKALVATPPMTDKPTRKPPTRRKKPNRDGSEKRGS